MSVTDEIRRRQEESRREVIAKVQSLEEKGIHLSREYASHKDAVKRFSDDLGIGTTIIEGAKAVHGGVSIGELSLEKYLEGHLRGWGSSPDYYLIYRVCFSETRNDGSSLFEYVGFTIGRFYDGSGLYFEIGKGVPSRYALSADFKLSEFLEERTYFYDPSRPNRYQEEMQRIKVGAVMLHGYDPRNVERDIASLEKMWPRFRESLERKNSYIPNDRQWVERLIADALLNPGRAEYSPPSYDSGVRARG